MLTQIQTVDLNDLTKVFLYLVTMLNTQTLPTLAN
jgi:hypothetical protein